eukprot:TRINITY_DN32999_c0_g1_i1.p1 TRINITY_DN32999_c0_g1~~TRINITY_DN32999_c0_g1_i1.p1  ORF type:complete len:594 (+),score=143.11 TRINITY_DN32999_c0_g1_i1:93-1874(+)
MATIRANVPCLPADGLVLKRQAALENSTRVTFVRGEGFRKLTSIAALSHVKSTSQVPRIIVRAARGSVDEEEDEKPKFLSKFKTQFFSPKDEVENGSGTRKATSAGSSLALIPKSLPGVQLFGRGRKADPNTIFVAGADGQTGSRITLELLREGFKVRAGVPDLREALKLAELASTYGLVSKEEAARLNVVEFSVQDAELTAKAMGNAGKVVVTLGPAEFGSNGKIAASDAVVVLEAAKLAKVANFVLVSSTSSSSVGEGPVNFFAKLFSFFSGGKGASLTVPQLVDRIVESDITYTLIQTGSTEGVSDGYGATSNIIVSNEGAGLTGKISKSQVAAVIGTAMSNVAAVENKVFEISASTEAPASPLLDLFSSIDLDGRREAFSRAQAQAEEEEKVRDEKARAQLESRSISEESRRAAEEAAALEREAKQLAAEEERATQLVLQAKARVEAVAASVSELGGDLKQAAGGKKLAFANVFAQAGAKVASEAKVPSFSLPSFDVKEKLSSLSSAIDLEGAKEKLTAAPAAAAAVAAPKSSSGRRPLKQRKDKVVEKTKKAVKEVPAAVQKPTEKRNVLGLFSQDTVYADTNDAGDF